MSIEALKKTMRALRDPNAGCPWDLSQNFASVAPYTIEEAYEVVDAIARDDMSDLRDELGDLLFQVVFHAQLAQEKGLFDFDDVARSVNEKMVRRHPHVFSDADFANEEAVARSWEAIKAEEQRIKRDGQGRAGEDVRSALESVPVGMPPLMRAAKLGRKASKQGFDWKNISGVWEKLSEELDELRFAVESQGVDEIRSELGDVLFSVVNLARHLKVEPDRALRECNQRFTERFAMVESLANAEELNLAGCTEQQLDAFWLEAKKRLSQEW